MKIERKFSPVTLTFETEKELTLFKDIVWGFLKSREPHKFLSYSATKSDVELAAQYLHERLSDK